MLCRVAPTDPIFMIYLFYLKNDNFPPQALPLHTIRYITNKLHSSSSSFFKFNLTGKGWEGFLQPPQYHNIYADSHLYMLFDPALWKLGAKAQTNNICQGYTTTQLEKVKGKIASGVVIGEYSLDFLTFPDFPYDAETEKNLQNLLLAEQKMYGVIGNADNAAVGAFFWSFKSLGRVKDDLTKLEDNPHSPWSYLSLLKDGIASKDLAKAEFNCTAFIAGYANQPPPAATPGVTTAGGPSGGAVQ